MAAEGVTAAVVTSYTESKYPILSRYHVGQHPLAKEAALKRLEPLPETRAAFTKALTREMTADGAETLDPHTVKKYQDKMVLEGLGKNVDLMYAREFQRWIRGVSVFNEPSMTPWGHRNMFHVPGVVEYLRELVQMRFDYQQSLMHLYMQPPQTLLDLELYYKYIVLQFGLVIPRNDGRVPNTGMPLAGDPRSFMSVSGMLSFLDDYQLTSFRDRDLPLTDQNKINLQDRNPNASLVGNLGPDIETLKIVHQGLGPENPMSNGQPSSGGASTPAPAPPNRTSAIVNQLKQQSKAIAAHVKQLENEATARKEDHDKDRKDRQRRHEEILRKMDEDTRQVIIQQPAHIAQSVVQQGAQSSEDLKNAHAAELKRRDEDYDKWRKDHERKMQEATASLKTAEVSAATSAEEAAQLRTQHSQLQKAYDQALAAEARAAKAAEEKVTAQMQASVDKANADLALLRAQFTGSEAQWKQLAETHQTQADKLREDLKHWQTQAATAQAGSNQELQAMMNMQLTNKGLAEENERLRQAVEAGNNQAALIRAELEGRLAQEVARQQAEFDRQLALAQASYQGVTSVQKETYEKAVADMTAMSAELAAAQREMETNAQTLTEREERIKKLKGHIKNRNERLEALNARIRSDKAQRDNEAALQATNSTAIGEYQQRLVAEKAQLEANLAAQHQTVEQQAAALAQFQATINEQEQLMYQMQNDHNTTQAALQALQEAAEQQRQQLAANLANAAEQGPDHVSAHANALQLQVQKQHNALQAVYHVANEQKSALGVSGYQPAIVLNPGMNLADQLAYYNDQIRRPEYSNNPALREEVRINALYVAADTLSTAQNARLKGDKLVSRADSDYVLNAFTTVFDAPLEGMTDEYISKYAAVVSQAYAQTVHALFGTTDDSADYATDVYHAIVNDDPVALKLAMNNATATARVANAFNVKMDGATLKTMSEGLHDIAGNIKQSFLTQLNNGYTVEQQKAGQQNAPLLGWDIGSAEGGNGHANVEVLSERASTQLALYADPDNLEALTASIGTSSALVKMGQTFLQERGDDADYKQQALKAIQRVKKVVDKGVSPVAALAYAGVTVDSQINELAPYVFTTVTAAEQEHRRLTDKEYYLLHEYALAVISKEALLFVRDSVIQEYAAFVNEFPDSEVTGFDAEEYEALNRVHQQVQAEKQEADKQLSLIGHHVLRSRLAHGVAQGGSAAQYSAAVQIASTVSHSSVNSQLAVLLSDVTEAQLSGSALVLAEAENRVVAVEAAHNAIQTHASAQLHSRAAIIARAAENLAKHGGVARSGGELVVYLADNLESRIGDITTEDANSLDLAVYTLSDFGTAEENVLAAKEAVAFRVLSEPAVADAAKLLNQSATRGNVKIATAEISLETLRDALHRINTESMVHEVLDAYIQKVDAHLRQQRVHGPTAEHSASSGQVEMMVY